jgi:hypothetical protein
LVTEDLHGKSLYLSTLKAIDADMISSASTTDRINLFWQLTTRTLLLI